MTPREALAAGLPVICRYCAVETADPFGHRERCPVFPRKNAKESQ